MCDYSGYKLSSTVSRGQCDIYEEGSKELGQGGGVSVGGLGDRAKWFGLVDGFDYIKTVTLCIWKGGLDFRINADKEILDQAKAVALGRIADSRL